MRTSLLLLVAFALCALAAAPATAQDTTVVHQDHPMEPMVSDVAGVVSGSPDHTALTAALGSAALDERLQGEGPFTVFAPTDEAFEAIPDEHAAMLRAPEHAEMLSGLLAYHVVPERLDAATLTERIEQGGGQATLTTVNGATLVASMDEAGNVFLTDAAGHRAMVTTADLNASNGVVHAIDAVLRPMPVSDDPIDTMNDADMNDEVEGDDVEDDLEDGDLDDDDLEEDDSN